MDARYRVLCGLLVARHQARYGGAFVSVFWHDTPADGEAPPPDYVRCMLCARLVEYDWIPFHSEDCDGIWWEDLP
jgi:hypothetical protein